MQSVRYFFLSVLLLSTITFARLRGKELLLNSSSNISVIRGKVDPSIQQVVTLVDSSILFSDLAQLESYKTRYAGNASGRDSLARARDWLIQQFTEYGYTDIQQHNFTQGGNQIGRAHV